MTSPLRPGSAGSSRKANSPARPGITLFREGSAPIPWENAGLDPLVGRMLRSMGVMREAVQDDASATLSPRPALTQVDTLVDSYRRLADVFHVVLAEQQLDAVLARIADTLGDLIPFDAF